MYVCNFYVSFLLLHFWSYITRIHKRNKLNDSISRLTAADLDTLTNQRELLLNKLEEFELKNRKLRKLLKETRKDAETDHMASERCEILLQKLTDSEARRVV